MTLLPEVEPKPHALGSYLDGLSDELRTALFHAEALVYGLGRKGLVELLHDQFPNIWEEVLAKSHEVDEAGFTIVETNLEETAVAEMTVVALAVSAVFGTPTGTDKVSGAYVWPVTPRSVGYSVTTFSEDIGEAAMHTDSQYIDKPEDKFVLACIRPDAPGRGTTELIDGLNLRREIEESHPGLLKVLQQPFPFRVPTVFTEKLRDDIPEIIWRPILEDDRIRYRNDTLINALQVDGVELDEQRMRAIEELAAIIDGMPRVQHHLMSGEIAIVDNRRMLHARTDFDDLGRVLLRVRMNDEIQV